MRTGGGGPGRSAGGWGTGRRTGGGIGETGGEMGTGGLNRSRGESTRRGAGSSFHGSGPASSPKRRSVRHVVTPTRVPAPARHADAGFRPTHAVGNVPAGQRGMRE